MAEKKEEKKIDYHEFEFGDRIDDLNACSTTDCTGLMWRAPYSDEERESYRDIYNYEPPYVEEGKLEKK